MSINNNTVWVMVNDCTDFPYKFVHYRIPTDLLTKEDYEILNLINSGVFNIEFKTSDKYQGDMSYDMFIKCQNYITTFQTRFKSYNIPLAVQSEKWGILKTPEIVTAVYNFKFR